MSEEKNRIAHALGSIPDVKLLNSVLEFALSVSRIFLCWCPGKPNVKDWVLLT